MMLVVDLDQLVGGARAVAVGLGALDIGIVHVALEPAARRFLEAALLLDLGRMTRVAPAATSGLPASWSFICPFRQLSGATRRRSAINSLNMPSRKPRSATRSLSDGHTARIASRMAQPASTRSARSAPMQGLATRWWKSQPSSFRDHAVDA
jgi:hypothetical protein